VLDLLNNKLILVFLIVLIVIALALILWLSRRLIKLESTNNRLVAESEQDREIIASTMDGLYTRDHKNGSEKCSRRLAILLKLEAGTEARFQNILDKFSDLEAQLLKKATEQLHQKGTSFNLILNIEKLRIQAKGTRTHSLSGSPLSDLIWMRDITNDPSLQCTPDASTDFAVQEDFRQLLDTLPLPVWIRDSKQTVVFSNVAENNIKASQTSLTIAKTALSENGPISDHLYIDSESFIVSEIPAYSWAGTIGFAEKIKKNDVSTRTLDTNTDVTRNEVLENLSTAIAIFGPNKRLSFFNSSYTSLWQFDNHWLANAPSLSEIIDHLRESRQLPEVADFRKFKEEQKNLFNTLNKQVEKLLHLPDGRTLRAIIGPCSDGGLIFSYEDVSQRLKLERSLKTLNAVQSETLDNLYEGIAVFGSDGKLKLSNPAFSQLWGLSLSELTGTPHLSDFINKTRSKISGVNTWNDEMWFSYAKNCMNQKEKKRRVNGLVKN